MTAQRQQEARQLPLVMLRHAALWRMFPPLRGGIGAPLAMRLTVEAMQSLSASDWLSPANAVVIRWTLKELRSRLWPDVTPPRRGRLLKALAGVRSAWLQQPTLSEWQKLEGARPIVWRIVDLDMSAAEGSGGGLDSEIVLKVTPPNVGERFPPAGPLAVWGARSAPAYNLLLMCGGAWAHGERVYIVQLGILAYPTNMTWNQAQLHMRGRRVLDKLVRANVLAVKGDVIEQGSAYGGQVQAIASPWQTVEPDADDKPREQDYTGIRTIAKVYGQEVASEYLRRRRGV